jgi:hypothetical protein
MMRERTSNLYLFPFDLILAGERTLELNSCFKLKLELEPGPAASHERPKYRVASPLAALNMSDWLALALDNDLDKLGRASSAPISQAGAVARASCQRRRRSRSLGELASTGRAHLHFAFISLFCPPPLRARSLARLAELAR